MFTIESLKKQKIVAMKTKNTAMKNVISLALGDLNTALLGCESGQVEAGKVFDKKTNKLVSIEEFVEMNLAKQLATQKEALKIYQERNDQEKVVAAQNEIDFISGTYFPQLSVEDMKAECVAFKAAHEGAAMKEWMNYLKEQFYGRYDGKAASQIFREV